MLRGRVLKYKTQIIVVVFLLLCIGGLLWSGLLSKTKHVDVVLLDGLDGMNEVIEAIETGMFVDALKEQEMIKPITRNYTDIWKVDDGSKVYWSIGKQGGNEGHDGSIEVKGSIFSNVDNDGNLIIVTGRSHVTFLMDSFDVDNIPNDGIKTLFLNHLHGNEFLDSDTYPFAQFVLDDVKEQVIGLDEKETYLTSGSDDVSWEIDGRLKIKDVIETLSLADVRLKRQGNNDLFFAGRLELSRYLWGLDAMPGVIDEFIVVEFELGLSRI